MTQPKKVAKTLTTLFENPIVKSILDLSNDLEKVIPEVQSWWGYDLLSRKPGSAYDEDGTFVGTDLDLACFLYALKDRGAVINLPSYKPIRVTKLKENEKVISKYDRHGKVTGVTANKEFFTFSIKIIDENVVGENKVGMPRNFSLTDFSGQWYPGWRLIQFVPTLNENKFITENKLWTGNKIIFKNFVHPNRWTSFFGQYYIMTKMLIERLEDEAQNLFEQQKFLFNSGFRFPEGEGPSSVQSIEVGKKKSLKFQSFEAKVYIPEIEYKGSYKVFDKSQKGLIDVYHRRNYFLFKVIPELRFMTRATEMAHFLQPANMPAWLENISWEPDFVEPGKRTKWDRIKLFQPAVGEFSVSLLKRVTEKSVQVDSNY
jgi:hypothetical protein